MKLAERQADMKKSNSNEIGENLRKQESVLNDHKYKKTNTTDRQTEQFLKALEGVAEEERRRRQDYQIHTPEEQETRSLSSGTGNHTISKASNSGTPIYRVQKQTVRKKTDQPKDEFRRKEIVFSREESDGEKSMIPQNRTA